jgi:hypothetical protein
LIITIRRSGDHQTDVAKLRLLHELLTEFRGANRFKFHLVGDSQQDGSLELAFPNDRTRYCPELEKELAAILGPDCYRLQ